MMATDQSPEILERTANTRKRMARVRSNQQTTMLTALAFSLIVAGIVSAALVATWAVKNYDHYNGFGNKPKAAAAQEAHK